LRAGGGGWAAICGQRFLERVAFSREETTRLRRKLILAGGERGRKKLPFSGVQVTLSGTQVRLPSRRACLRSVVVCGQYRFPMSSGTRAPSWSVMTKAHIVLHHDALDRIVQRPALSRFCCGNLRKNAAIPGWRHRGTHCWWVLYARREVWTRCFAAALFGAAGGDALGWSACLEKLARGPRPQSVGIAVNSSPPIRLS